MRLVYPVADVVPQAHVHGVLVTAALHHVERRDRQYAGEDAGQGLLERGVAIGRPEDDGPPLVYRRLGSLSSSMILVSSFLQQAASNSAGGMLPLGSSSRRWLNQSSHSSVAYSTSSLPFQGPRRRISSVL